MRLNCLALFYQGFALLKRGFLFGLLLVVALSTCVGCAQVVLYPATPFISPAGATYTSGRAVTISETTAETTVYYTTDGSQPSTKSLEYTGPITLPTAPVTETIRAIAVRNAYASSSTSATFTIAPPLPTPTYSPAAGNYMQPQTVTLSTSFHGAVIYYTVDGTLPSAASPVYNGNPIQVLQQTTIRSFVAGSSGYSPSGIVSQTYNIMPAEPFISPAAGTYATGQSVTISDGTPGSVVYFTTDGSTPTLQSTKYTAPITIPAKPVTETIRAVAVNGQSSSSSISATYTIAPALPAPTYSPAAGSFMTPQSVTLSTSYQGGVIHYTVDGSLPSAASPVYNGAPIQVAEQTTIRSFVAGTGGYSPSVVTSQTYNIIPTTPFISPAAGTYPTGQTVTISDTTPGSVVYFTTDGSAPTTQSSRYSAPITIPTQAVTETIRAVAALSGVSGSSTSSTFKITPPTAAPAPSISPAPGKVTTNQLVTISDSLVSARIFYTLDGSAPSTQSTLYTAPFYLPASQSGKVVVSAIAAQSGYLTSPLSQAAFTFGLPQGVIASTVLLNTKPVDSIPTSFLGFSHEWGVAETLMGDKANGVNTSYRTLVSTLADAMGGPLVLRVGGGSTDTSGTATAATVQPFIELAQAENVKFILGVNLGSNDLPLAEQQAGLFIASVPSSSLLALEIGNEPDSYATNGMRSSNYSWSSYLSQFQQWQQGVGSLSNTTPVAGPVLGGGSWVASAESSAGNDSLNPSLITHHRYVACYNPSDPFPSGFLLQPSSATSSIPLLEPYVAAAHERKLSFRLGETNSICLGGQAGVSDTFSAALWAVDTMFELANIGVDGVNWNSNFDGGAYDLFHFSSPTGGKYFLLQVRPLYYGLLLFAQAAGNNAQLLSTSTLASGNVKVWVMTNGNGHAHLVIINKETSLSGNVQVALSGYGSGVMTTLEAPSYQSTSGVTIAGQTYDGSSNGSLQGTASTSTIYPANGLWSVPVAAMSAVSVDLQP
jgi:hypothetical protein